MPILDEDEQEEKFEVWPENVKVVRAFVAMDTQWREVVVDTELIKRGLRYESIPIVLRSLKGIHRKEWPDIFQGLREMEAAALKTFRELRQSRPN